MCKDVSSPAVGSRRETGVQAGGESETANGRICGDHMTRTCVLLPCNQAEWWSGRRSAWLPAAPQRKDIQDTIVCTWHHIYRRCNRSYPLRPLLKVVDAYNQALPWFGISYCVE